MEDQSGEFYGFKMEEERIVEGLRSVVRAVLQRPRLKAIEIYRLSLLMRALERLPLVTSGLGVELSLINRESDGGWGYLSVEVGEESVEFRTGESIPSPSGNDHTSRSIDVVGVGWRKEDSDFFELEEWVTEFQNRAEDPDQELSLSDHDSEVDWYDQGSDVDYYDAVTRERLWGDLDSDFA